MQGAMDAIKKILIVDDEPLFLELLEQRLSPRYRVFSALDGAEAIEMAREHRPDLILSDLIMPRMDGLQLFEILKGRSETARTPFIILSADGDSTSIRRACDQGVSDYLIKPLHLEDLPAVIEKYL